MALQISSSKPSHFRINVFLRLSLERFPILSPYVQPAYTSQSYRTGGHPPILGVDLRAPVVPSSGNASSNPASKPSPKHQSTEKEKARIDFHPTPYFEGTEQENPFMPFFVRPQFSPILLPSSAVGFCQVHSTSRRKNSRSFHL